MTPRTLAIVPARGGSKRVPGKNIRPLLGTPLIEWTAVFAQSVHQFTTTVVSTDDPDIERAAIDAGIGSLGLRPADLASDTATTADVALHTLNQAEERDGTPYDMVALLQPTTPWRLAMRWDDAFRLMHDTDAPAVVGVGPMAQTPFHSFARDPDGALSPLFASHLQTRSQDLPQAVVVNGALYLIRADVLRQTRGFFPIGSMSVLCDTALENIDIDTENDWAHCVCQMQNASIKPPQQG